MDWRMERQAPFLKSVLREADHHERQELLRMASADENNAISELVMNTIAKAHDIAYGKAKDLKDKRIADRKMIAKIDKLPGRKTLTERIVKNIMKAMLKLGI